MSKPEALRLARELEACPTINYKPHAAELRRLHEANEAFGQRQEWWNEKMFTLEQQRDALLEALKEIDSWLVCSCIATAEDMAQSFPHMQQVASAAIKAVEETK